MYEVIQQAEKHQGLPGSLEYAPAQEKSTGETAQGAFPDLEKCQEFCCHSQKSLSGAYVEAALATLQFAGRTEEWRRIKLFQKQGQNENQIAYFWHV